MRSAATCVQRPHRSTNQTSRPLLPARPLLHQRTPALPIPFLGNLEDEIRPLAGQRPGEQTLALDAAELGHYALRAPVLSAEPDHGVDAGGGEGGHEPLCSAS